MTSFTRRDVLRAALATGGARLLGTVRLQPFGQPAASCPNPFAGGRAAGTVPFAGVDRLPPFHAVLGSGLDARLYTDLSTLTADTLVTPNHRFFVRTGWPDGLEPPDRDATWTVRVTGLVKQPVALSLRDLEPLAVERGPFLMECAGNTDEAAFGLMSAAIWTGAPVAAALKKAGPLPRATRVRISGVDRHSQPSRRSLAGASWVFTVDELDSAGALLATRMNGEPLPRDHGWPVRLIVPGWYGCTCIKWVDEIALVDETAAATTQMREFAARTFQEGAPALAREYRPASMDLAAVPVRIEQWLLDGAIVYRVVGIMWGGAALTSRLRIRFNPSEPYQPVEVCPPPSTPLTWTLWTHLWKPRRPGRYQIVLKPDDPAIRSTRLDLYFYTRTVWIEEV
jgi:DMSO/TMAO reductase YedYZ molybdopterin-dependent catalytic subunit